ncbi:LTA synthase family protein [Paenibacillus sp. 7541]|uniref:LTA synthase family protein n=1 Tax=Paenibacillus sp. 7541 TaxID=2026236 RepID=UPI000BA5C7A2|nr:LTA synthase family protein [Paenibacillus sp. 7541]PAK55864.1 sulfatase [Paenibacillus sp. 7541]
MELIRKDHIRWFIGVFILLLVKLILLRSFLFGGMMWGRVLPDALSILAVLSLLELVLPNKGKRTIYWCFNLLFSLMLFAAAVYNVYFGSIPTYTALSGIGQVNQVKGSVQALIRPAHFLFFADVIVIAAVWTVRKLRARFRRGLMFRLSPGYSGLRTSSLVWKTGMAGMLVVTVLLSGWIMRGAWGIENEIARAEQMGFMNYQVEAAIRNQRENRMLAKANREEVIAQVKQLQDQYPYRDEKGAAPAYYGIAEGKNVLVVQMESLQTFPIGLTLDGQELTPVMNHLVEEGLYFPHIFQQIGQGNTSDAEFAVNTSIYPTGTIAMSTGYGNKELPSLPRMLNRLGYVTNTFHVNDINFWNRSKLYPALQFQQYYDKPYFQDDHFNDFGPSDEELFRVGMRKIKELHAQNTPFYTNLITVSNHSPYTLKDEFVKIALPEELEGTHLGKYLKSVNYSDYALGVLVEDLKKNGLWDNTVLVVYGDHFGINQKEASPEQISSVLGIRYHERISRFNIPLIMHVPGIEGGQVIDQVGGQVDLLPTIANLLGIRLEDEQLTAFGQDLLNIDRNVVGMRYYLPTGSFFNNEIMFVPGDGFEDGTAVRLDTLEPVEDVGPYRSDYDYIMQLMKLSDDYVKLLPDRASKS